MRIPVVVDCRDRGRLRWHFKLRRFGLEHGDGAKYRGLVTERRAERLKEYCRENHLKFYIDNRYGTRGSSYRARFLRNHASVFGCFYFCAYCGKPLSKKRLTVDHLYPVAKVSRDPKLQKKLHRQGIDDLNSEKNLVPACYRCNQSKAANMGAWIRRGKVGRHAWIWCIRWLLRFLLLAALIAVVWNVYGFLHTGNAPFHCIIQDFVL